MNSDPLPERGWRGSREVWLAAARAALVDKGVSGVKIMPLAKALNLSRTSFYWFFKDRGALCDALFEEWEAATTAPLVAATHQTAATETEAMLNVIATFVQAHAFDVRMELAVRAWAQQDHTALIRVQEADARRLGALRDMLLAWGHDPLDADVRARTIYLVQVGYISMRTSEPLDERLSRFPHYVEIYTGKRPSVREMDRVRARVMPHP